MVKRIPTRLYILLAAMALVAVPASAQFTPRTLNDPATGEKFHIEGSAGFWNPTSAMWISSEGLGIPGSKIDFKKDLGLTDQRFREFHVVLRPARKHKLRMQYIPIEYLQSATVSRDVVFNGQLYKLGVPVSSSLSWKAYRFAYEYDFVARNRGFAGVVLDAKYTELAATLQVQQPAIKEFTRIKAPIPAIGGIGRFYVVPNISITGELTGIKIPESIAAELPVGGHYADFDLHGTVNFTGNLGAQVGYRSLDLGAQYTDHGVTSAVALPLKGLYFGLVARY